MHIAASNPLALSSELIDQSVIDKEQELVTEELKNSGKPDDIAKKIIDAIAKKNTLFLFELNFLYFICIAESYCFIVPTSFFFNYTTPLLSKTWSWYLYRMVSQSMLRT